MATNTATGGDVKAQTHKLSVAACVFERDDKYKRATYYRRDVTDTLEAWRRGSEKGNVRKIFRKFGRQHAAASGAARLSSQP
ncbi:hypothetical protein BDW66DRAFT_128310 [Aspergillus desertorum]